MSVKAFMVLGMHRSATSLMSKALHEQGVVMASDDDLLPPGRGNELGHYESKKLVSLNDHILAEAGGAWDDPPSVGMIDKAADVLSHRFDEYIQYRTGPELWGMKDPRLALTFRPWRKALQRYAIDVHIITCWRSPNEVAKSLYERDGIDVQAGRGLAKEYQRRIREHI